ncbi:response regulator [candidate division KSB1 bacterium]|nr:response regulator [candidate division KSB1 bacterium]
MSQAKRILIIEDDVEVREAWEDVLQEQGYKVFQDGTTDEAIKSLRQQKFDLFLLDMSVPPAGREGGLLFLQAKSHNRLNKNTPVIIVTGIAVREDIKHLSQRYNIVEILEKPVENNALCKVIDMVLSVNEQDSMNKKEG